MRLIIDANIIIAMLIKPGEPIDLFFKDELKIFAPSLLFLEVENKKEIIRESSGVSIEDINKLITTLKKRINIIPEKEFGKYRKIAERICPDPDDITYFALALYLKCPIWSNEKKLQEQSEVKIYPTHDLIRLFNHPK